MRRLRSIPSAAILTTNPLAQQFSRKILPTSDDVRDVVEKVLTEIEDIKNNISADRVTVAKQKTDSIAGNQEFKFRPLTEEEKKEFVSSLDAKGKQILAQFADESKNSNDSDEDVGSICGL